MILTVLLDHPYIALFLAGFLGSLLLDFAGVQPKIFSYFQIHAVYFCQIAARRLAIIPGIGFHLPQSLDLLLKASDAFLCRFQLLIALNHR